MNTLILFDSDKRNDDTFDIKDPKRLFHLREILKVKVGDDLKVGLLNGNFGKAKVEALGENAVLKVSFFEKNLKPRPQVTLSIGLSRPPTLKKILEHATSMGVSHFEFYRAELSEKSYASSKIFEADAIEELLINGLSQSSLSLTKPTVSISNRGVEALQLQEQNFLLSLKGERGLARDELDFSRPLHFVLGPERGFTQREESLLIERGFKPIMIHQGVLRVEIATFALLGGLEFIFQNHLNKS